ncbi:unnamed protein product, partial [Symbiodinium microadriaticum]
ADETMGNIIQAKYTSFANYDQDYPSLDGLVDRSAMPAPRQTKASTSAAGRAAATKSGANSTQSTGRRDIHFTMKKFQNVPGKLNLPKVSPGRSKARVDIEDSCAGEEA